MSAEANLNRRLAGANVRQLLIVAFAIVVGIVPFAATNFAHAQGVEDRRPIEVLGNGSCLVFSDDITFCDTPWIFARFGISMEIRIFEIHVPKELDIQLLTDYGSFSQETGNQSLSDPVNQGAMICGNPFNILSGNKVQQEFDYVGNARFPLTFSRTFNSAQPTVLATPLGKKWWMGLPQLDNWRELEGTDTITWKGMILVRADGQRVKLRANDGPPLPGKSTPTTFFTRTNGKEERLYQSDEGIWIYFDRLMEYRFDSTGRITLQIDRPSGEYHKYEYPNASSLYPSKITHSSGDTLTFTYSQDRLVRLRDPAGNQIHYEYNLQGNLNLVRYPATAAGTATKAYFYENSTYPDHLTRMVDQAGVEKKWTYDASGRATGNETNTGINTFEVLSRNYNSSTSQWEVRTRNALGKQAVHTFAQTGGRYKAVGTVGDALGNCEAASSTITYDPSGYYNLVTDGEGNVTDYDFDVNGRLGKITEGFGSADARTTDFEYDPVSELLLRVENDEQKTVYDYGPDVEGNQGRLRKIISTDKLGGSSTREYVIDYPVVTTTAEGSELVRKVLIDGPRTDVADTTEVTFDAIGRLTSVRNAAGQVTVFSNYDTQGRARTITYPSGMITSLVYNARGWLTSKNEVVATKDISSGATVTQTRTTTYDYEIDGSLKRVTYPDATYVQFGYDVNNRLKAVQTSPDEWITLDYDNAGNLERERIRHNQTQTTYQYTCCDQHGEPIITPVTQNVAVTDKTTSYGYDALSRLESITEGSGSTWLVRYNKNDLVRLIEDAKGNQTVHDYNERNELEQIVNRDGGIVGQTYDDNALLDTVTDAIGVTTDFVRNGFGEIETELSPDAGNWTYTYDKAGNLKQTTDARNYVTTYHYDALNRIERIDHPSGVDTEYNYNPTSGWLELVTDDSGSTTFERDTSGAITKKISVVNGVTMVTQYQYDLMGRVEEMKLPGGTSLYYEFDDVGRVSRIEASHSSFSRRNLASSISYKPFGPMTRVTLGTNQVRNLHYDSDYRLTRLVSANQIYKTYNYDDNGNITSVTNGSGYGDRTYGYDQMDRLVYHYGPDGSYYLHFDKNGNLTRRNSFYYDNHTYDLGTNRLAQAAGNLRYYDGNGNTTTLGADYLTFDARNRLSRFYRWAGHVSTYYRYNAFGERVQKYRSGFDKKFVYGGGARLIHERGAHGTIDYIYLNGVPIAMVSNGSLYYIHADHLGRPLRVSTESNYTIWSADDRAWETHPFSQLVYMNLRFPGQYYDSESGLYYNFFRYYDPQTSRYLSSDPIGLAGGMNRFAYAGSNPVNRIDPFGLVAYSGNSNPLILNYDSGDWNRTSGTGRSCATARRSDLLQQRYGRYVRSMPTERSTDGGPSSDVGFDYFAGGLPRDPIIVLVESEMLVITGASAVAACISSGACAAGLLMARAGGSAARKGAATAASVADAVTLRAAVSYHVYVPAVKNAVVARTRPLVITGGQIANGISQGYGDAGDALPGRLSRQHTVPGRIGYAIGYMYQYAERVNRGWNGKDVPGM